MDSLPLFGVHLQSADGTYIYIPTAKLDVSVETKEPRLLDDGYIYGTEATTYTFEATTPGPFFWYHGGQINDTPIYDRMMREFYA